MVGAVVEQVYSSTIPSVKNTRNMSHETLYCTSKCTKMCLVAGLHPDSLGRLQRSPRPPAELRGGSGKREGEGEMEEEVKGRMKGKDSPLYEVR